MTDEPDDSELIEQVREQLTVPVFNPQLVPVQVDENTIHVRAGPWSGPVLTITDVDEDDVITDLVNLVDGTTHVDDIFAQFEDDQRTEVANTLSALAEKFAVYDADDVDGPLYDHNVLKTQFSRRERDRVDEKSVLVVTDGRMGRYVAEDLLEVGVGAVEFAPLDGAEPPRVAEEAANFSTVSAEDLRGAIEDADFVVFAADGPSPELETVNELAVETGTPWTVGQIRGFDGIVGPAIFPGETACYECFRERMLSNLPNIGGYQRLEVTKRENDLATASLPMFSRAVAGYLSLDVLHLLAFGIGYTSGRVLTVNSLDLSMEVNEVLKLPRCDVCGRDVRTDTSRFVTLDDLVEGNRISSVGDD